VQLRREEEEAQGTGSAATFADQGLMCALA
jgi:hypothetical protein